MPFYPRKVNMTGAHLHPTHKRYQQRNALLDLEVAHLNETSYFRRSPLPGCPSIDIPLNVYTEGEEAIQTLPISIENDDVINNFGTRNSTPNRVFWPEIETPPPMEIEVVRLPGQYDQQIKKISGRRIVDIQYFVTEIRKLENHECNVSKTGYLSFDKEVQQGLHSRLYFKCTACVESRVIDTSPRNINECNDLNLLASWSMIADGKAHATLENLHTMLEIPSMAKNTFLINQTKVGDLWYECLTKSISEAGQEEYEHAVSIGKVVNGVGRCTVIVDGGWSRRSYGHRYNALSGVACIIGQHSKKILFAGVRNKYCSICSIALHKSVTPQKHKCYKNWEGSSPAMEADIIVEGFQSSEKMHNLWYTAFIGDGDSSVYSKILANVTYCREITKIECANHLVKNVTKHLYNLANESADNKKDLPSNVIQHISKTCRKLIAQHARKPIPSADELKIDLHNAPQHCYGNHINCRAEDCLKHGIVKVNNKLSSASSEFRARMSQIIGNLCSKSDSLILDCTSNAAEQFMAQVAKFNDGKVKFYGRRNSYNIRCNGAALAFQYGPAWISESWKNSFVKSPSRRLKRLILNKQKSNERCRLRRKIFPVKNVPNKNNDGKADYGLHCTKPDLPDIEVQELIQKCINVLGVTKEKQEELEIATRGQRLNNRWKQERKYRLTASRFGEICKRKVRHGKLVESMLYSVNGPFKALEWGVLNEPIAVKHYMDLTSNIVQDCGIFVCTEEGLGFLGASPDGLVGDDKIVEVKCPYSARQYSPQDAAEKIKSFYLRLDKNSKNLSLDRKHNYYYQIQGQLFISQRKLCDFIVWTPKGTHIETINIDHDFIQRTMLPKLINFYWKYFGPELVDSRRERNMPLRYI
ncbi:exonuclease phage-type/recb c-terminal domain-containing protein [Holotrichia oblita]|uniref:Exonuclease phage-type/recb c-terminal domain-containing protein n=1 Tax=Holotrichia oblita TaxID=644536 RepID=A0ACB9TEQ9_HOLOL|nr:exonuclease phage-type/recb c-terminal domain-containing protein [Holotrichia oblita]